MNLNWLLTWLTNRRQSNKWSVTSKLKHLEPVSICICVFWKPRTARNLATAGETIRRGGIDRCIVSEALRLHEQWENSNQYSVSVELSNDAVLSNQLTASSKEIPSEISRTTQLNPVQLMKGVRDNARGICFFTTKLRDYLFGGEVTDKWRSHKLFAFHLYTNQLPMTILL